MDDPLLHLELGGWPDGGLLVPVRMPLIPEILRLLQAWEDSASSSADERTAVVFACLGLAWGGPSIGFPLGRARLAQAGQSVQVYGDLVADAMMRRDLVRSGQSLGRYAARLRRQMLQEIPTASAVDDRLGNTQAQAGTSTGSS